MSELSTYIHKQLKSLLTSIKSTPPKRSVSLDNLKKLVQEAPIRKSQKKDISRSIRTVETAMKGSKRLIITKNKYAKNLFYENMLLEERQVNLKKIGQSDSFSKFQEEANQDEYNKLFERLTSLRQTRLSRQSYLQELVVQTQRLERLITIRTENQQKYLKSKKLDEEFTRKKNQEKIIKQEVRKAAKDNRRKTVHSLISKYHNFIKG